MPLEPHNVNAFFGLPDESKRLECMTWILEYLHDDLRPDGSFHPTGPVVQGTAQAIGDVPLLPEDREQEA